ncbi:MAG: peptidoglycan DD-metalloendopeptidase family protein [Bacillota bacterium]
MSDKNKDDRTYFFSVDRDKIKIKLKEMGSKYLSSDRRNKIVALIIVFCFVLGIGIAVYRGNNLNTGKEEEEIPPEIIGNFDLQREELTLPESDKTSSREEETEEKTDSAADDKAEDRGEVKTEEGAEDEAPFTRPVQPVAGEEDDLLRPVDGEIIRQPGWYYDSVFADWRYQEGVLLRGDRGDVVMAAEDGEVESVKEDPYRGVMVTIDHGEGTRTVYGHLQRAAVSSGEVVGKGQEVGQIGTTDITSENSLYFELRDGDEVLDATRYFDR